MNRAMAASDRYAFGSFVLERSQQRVLRSDGTELHLTPRLFSALLLFVENPGVLLDKDRLMQSLWPGLVVEENNLSQTISGLRRALGDGPQGSQYIQTVARRGFRFIADVTVLPDAAAAAPASPPPADAGPEQPAAVDAPQRVDRRRRVFVAAGSGAAAVLAGAGWWAWRHAVTTASAGAAASDATVAVLPFKPLAAESRDELLEVGMADSLITRLSTVPGLVVRSVRSVRRYAGAEQDPIRAAQDLNVAWIVDGSLQRRGDQLRVSARLLRTADGSAAWSGSFDEKFNSVFDVQDQISTRVMLALAPRLASQAGVAAGARPTDLGGTRNTDAYELYLAAARQLQIRRANSTRKGIELLNQALTFDPTYALAYAALAEAHRETLLNSDAVPARATEAAKAAVQRALALAPNLAEAMTENAYSHYYFAFDWPGAEREFRRALTINANMAPAHFGLAQLLLTQDRTDEGFVHLRLARELDPMSPFFNSLEASYLLASGRLEQARIRLNRAFDIAPDFWFAHRTQGLLHLAEHHPDLAIASLRRAVEMADGNSRINALLGMHLARLGRHDEARAIQLQLLDLAKSHYLSPVSLAVMHAALGETAQALDALERAYEIRDVQLVFLKDDPRWSSLRSEPRFVALMRKLKLDRYGPGLSPTS